MSIEAIISTIARPALSPKDLEEVLQTIAAERLTRNAQLQRVNNRRRAVLLTNFTPDQLAAVEQEAEREYLALERLDLAEEFILDQLEPLGITKR